jgi:NAD(P)-dependent dehydrogenase (short-subunit alcohol dehydrogenase family)
MTHARYPSLTDRTVLITGGATGIGASLVEHFADQGAKVGFIDIDASAGAALAETLAASRNAPFFVDADLKDIAALEGAIDAVRQRFGPILALLNSAANDRRHSIDETTAGSHAASRGISGRSTSGSTRSCRAG